MKHTSSWALRRVLKSLGRYLPLLLASLLLAAASVAGTLYIPILVGDAIDQIVGPGRVDFAAVSTLAVRIAVLAGLTAILQWVMTAIHNRVCFCVTRDVAPSGSFPTCSGCRLRIWTATPPATPSAA